MCFLIFSKNLQSWLCESQLYTIHPSKPFDKPDQERQVILDYETGNIMSFRLIFKVGHEAADTIQCLTSTVLLGKCKRCRGQSKACAKILCASEKENWLQFFAYDLVFTSSAGVRSKMVEGGQNLSLSASNLASTRNTCDM